MFNKIFIIFIVCFSTLFQNSVTSLEIDECVEKCLDTFHVPGTAVGVIVDGEVVLTKGYGLRNVEKGLPVTDRTLFPIGSCTKAFTTFVLATLVDEGKVQWDDPVIKHIPDFRLFDQHATHKCTIRDLLTHRTGIPRHDLLWYNSNLSLAELTNRVQYLEPVADLREKFIYNNLMYGVAGHLIERVTGQTWEQVVQERIFDPLEMSSCNFSVDDSQKSSDFSLPYSGENAIPFRNITNIGPAGAINSSIKDMVKWLQLQLSQSQDTLKEMHTLQISLQSYPTGKINGLGYGLGWGIGTYDGHYLVEHAGGIDGFISYVSFLPEKKIGVVILTNSATGGMFLSLALRNAIFDNHLEIAGNDWIETYQPLFEQKPENSSIEPGPNPTHPLEDYVGSYEHPAYGIVRVTQVDDQLVATLNGIDTLLVPKQYDAFVGSDKSKDPVFARVAFSFSTDVSGSIAELHIPLEPLANPIVFKKKPDETFLTPEYLNQFVGSYTSDVLNFKIERKGNQLFVTLPGEQPLELLPESELMFKFKDIQNFSLRFILNTEGQVEAVDLVQLQGTLRLIKL